MDRGAEAYRRFLGGDRDALAEIIRDYQPGLTLYLSGITGSFSAAEDLVEDTFVKLAADRPRFMGGHAFKTWLYTIGRHLAIDFLRRRRDLPLEEEPGALEDLETTYLRQEERIHLHRALAALKPEYRQALYLSYFEEMSNAQVAAVMKKTKRQVENLLHRGRVSLKAQLEKEGYFHEELS